MGKVYEDLSSSGFNSNTEGLVFKTYNSSLSHPYRVFHPKKMDLGIQDVDMESGRAASGYMVRNRVGTKRMLSLTFPPMTNGEMAQVLRAVSTYDSSYHVGDGLPAFFQVTYTDPLEGSSSNGYRVTKWFYPGDRVTPCYTETGNGLWEELTVDLVER